MYKSIQGVVLFGGRRINLLAAPQQNLGYSLKKFQISGIESLGLHHMFEEDLRFLSFHALQVCILSLSDASKDSLVFVCGY